MKEYFESKGDGVEGWVNVDGWCIVVEGGRVETWEITREGVDG